MVALKMCAFPDMTIFLGEVFSQNIRNRMDLVATGNSLARDDQYMGYSMAVIKIKGSQQRYAEEYILVGTPKGNNLTGEGSNHFSIPLKHFHNLSHTLHSCYLFLTQA